MKNSKPSGMTITEAASVLGVRKNEAIALAEATFLTFINDGKNGKAKTVTYDSVFSMKRSGGTEEALERIAKDRAPAVPKEVPVAAHEAVPAPAMPGNVQISRSAMALIEAVHELTSEVRQLKGILCHIVQPKQQELNLK